MPIPVISPVEIFFSLFCLLFAVLLNGLSYHLGIGIVFEKVMPQNVFLGFVDTRSFGERLRNKGLGVADAADGVVDFLSVSHGDNLLYIFDFVFSRGRVSLALSEISIAWGKEKPVL